MNNIYQYKRLKERMNASLVCSSSGTANSDVSNLETKPSVACRRESTGSAARPNVGKHSVFVLDKNGKPLTPTTPAKARKLLKGEKAKKVWSKFNTFGVQLLEKTRNKTPKTALGYDPGAKYEGISVVCGEENNLSVKLNLPDKKKIVRKMEERKILRHARRQRKCRKRRIKKNYNIKKFIAPSQKVLLFSRLKILKEFCKIFPISSVAIENVKFNHFKYRYGANFSSIELTKNEIKKFFKKNNIKIFEYLGFETQKLRKKYRYKKTNIKNLNTFNSHCSDSLALALAITCNKKISKGLFLIIDDTYRCVRRKLHTIQFAKGNIRKKISSIGSIHGVGKGVIIGTRKNKSGQLCGAHGEYFRYYDLNNVRQMSKYIVWINNRFKILKV